MLFYKICLGFIWIQIYFHSTKISYAMQKAHMCVCASGEGGERQSCPVDLGPERKDQRNIFEVNT